MGKTQPKQLKKNDFLNAVTDELQTRDEIKESLSDFEFIDSYLDYLIDHFISRGRVEEEDGKFRRKAGKSAATPKPIFRVVETDDGFELEEKENKGLISDEDKEQGWCVTANAAVKKECSAEFQHYKSRTDAIRSLLD